MTQAQVSDRFVTDSLEGIAFLSPSQTGTKVPRVKPSPFRKQLQLITKALHKYGCLLLPMPEQLAQEIIAWAQAIPDNDLGPGGRELEPHLTLKYGFTDDSPEAIQILRALLVRHGPITVQLKEVGLFKNNEDGDVLKIDVDSQELHELNAAISELVHTEDKYPTYLPHVTIAYLKPAVAEQYLAGTFPFLGKTIILDRAQYACADGTSVDISLSFMGGDGLRTAPPKALFSYLYKGEGEPCEQGETAAQSGCIPASGEGSKKPSKTKKPSKSRDEAKDAVLQAVLATGFTAAQAGLLKPANVAKKAGISKEQAQELLQEIAAEAKGEKPAKTTAPTKVHGVKAPAPDDTGFADFVVTTFQQPEFDEEAATALVATDAFNPSYFSHGHEWNDSLRKGGPVTETMQRVDKAIHSSTLGQDLEVTRGVSDMEFKEGQELSDAGYGSWTLYDQVAVTYTTGVATSGSGQKPTIVRCVLPKGSKGLYLEKVAEEFGLDPVDVHEVVIPRNSKYRVTKVNSGVNIAGKTVNEVVLEIVQ